MKADDYEQRKRHAVRYGAVLRNAQAALQMARCEDFLGRFGICDAWMVRYARLCRELDLLAMAERT